MIREERQKKRRQRRIAKMLGVVAAILLVLVFVVLIGFSVQSVEIEGNEIYSTSEISSMIFDNAAANNSLYLYIKYNLFPQEDVAFIDTVEVRLLSPHKVKIVVYEKGILGYITSEDEVTTSGDASGDSSGDLQLDSVSADASGVASGDAVQMLTYQYFDKDGIIVEESHSLVDTVPQVIGATEENLELYDTISFSSKTALKYLLELTQDLDKYDVQVDAVTVKEDGSITLTYREVTVSLGKNSDTAEKVERLAKILPQLTDRSGTIDLSDWAEDSSDIIFQEY